MENKLERIKLIVSNHLNHVEKQAELNPEKYTYTLEVLNELNKVINEDSLPVDEPSRSL